MPVASQGFPPACPCSHRSHRRRGSSRETSRRSGRLSCLPRREPVPQREYGARSRGRNAHGRDGGHGRRGGCADGLHDRAPVGRGRCRAHGAPPSLESANERQRERVSMNGVPSSAQSLPSAFSLRQRPFATVLRHGLVRRRSPREYRLNAQTDRSAPAVSSQHGPCVVGTALRSDTRA